jgi:hypothetical protein
VYTGRSLLHTWYPEPQLFGILNAHTLLQLDSKVRGFAYRIHWRPERQSSHTGKFLLATALNYLYNQLSNDEHKQIGIRRGARSFQLRGGFKAKLKLTNSQGLKDRLEKFKKQ